MSRTIVVALPPPAQDTEPVAEGAIPFARALAERDDATVLLVSVIDLLPTFNPLTRSLAAPSPKSEAALVAEAEAYLARLAEAFPGVRVETKVRTGNPPTELIAAVAGRDQPMFLVTSHARTGIDRLILGSVASQLVRNAPCPVLVVRARRPRDERPDAPQIARVLVPLDQSSFAEHALAGALAALGPADLHLHLLTVVEPIGRPTIDPDEIVRIVAPKADRYLHEVAQPLLERGYRVTTEIRYGHPAEEIARAATEQTVDLIAMTTHGRSGFRRFLLGSVAEQLLHSSPVPLLLVRPAESEPIATTTATRDRREPAAAPALWERRVRELMTPGVITVHEQTPLVDVVATMLKHRIGCVPVVDEHGLLTGIITESDFVGDDRYVPLAAFQVPHHFREQTSDDAIERIYRAGQNLTAGQIMTRPVVTAEADEPAGAVVERLIDRGINRAPVVRDGAPIGIVARHDLLKLLIPPRKGDRVETRAPGAEEG